MPGRNNTGIIVLMKLIIDNSYSQIVGSTSETYSELRKLLSYSVDVYGQFPRKKYLLDAKGFFPTGLLNKVLAYLNTHIDVYAIDDNRKLPKFTYSRSFVKGTNVPWIAQGRACTAAIMHKHGCISMPTGTGKSVVISLIVQSIRVKTLIVVPTVELKNQLKQTLKLQLGSLKGIEVENISSTRLKKLNDFECLIIDESHHVAAKTYQTLNKTAWKSAGYRFFLTATPFRNNPEEQLLFEGIAGPVIYELSYKEAIKQKYIIPVQAYYVNLPKQPVEGYSWAQVYSELVVNNDIRNGVIASLIASLKAEGKSVLCLVKEVAHGLELSKMASVAFTSGQDRETREYIKEFNLGRITALIGTTGILGEGIDTKPAEYVIIAGLGKAKSAFMQQIGRAVRKHPGKESAKIIIFRDLSHKWTAAHYRAQKKILLDEYGVTPVEL